MPAGPPAGGFCRLTKRRGLLSEDTSSESLFRSLSGCLPPAGCMSEETSSECLFFSPSGWGRSAGLLFQRGKSRQKRAGETPAPLFLPTRTIQDFEAQLPLNFQLYFVIGAAGHALRLSALESIGTSNDAKQTDGSVPLRGRQPKLDQIPATDQMPKSTGSVAAQYQT